MTLSVITTDVAALSAGLPFALHPDDCSFAILVSQEPTGSLTVVQSSGGTLLGSGGGGGVSSTVTLAAGTALAGTFALSTGGTVAVAGTVGVTGTFWQTTQPVTMTVLPALATGSNVIGGVTQSGAWTVGLSAGQTITLGGSNSVTLAAGSASVGTFSLASTTFTLAAGTASIGTVILGAGTSSIGTLAGIASNVPVYLNAVSSGGVAVGTGSSWINTAASTMAAAVKASSGMVYEYSVSNANSSAVYFRLYNSSTAPTAGSTVPVVRMLVAAGATVSFSTAIGLYCNSGIGFAVTTGSLADSDTTAVATANTVTVNIGFK
jgi:hypothetical protein